MTPRHGLTLGLSLITLAGAAAGPVRSTARDAVHVPFTVVGLPDTQFYSQSYPDIFHAQTQWVADNLRTRNIRFVSHYGDLVQHGDNTREWSNAKAAMRRLDDAGVPYGVVPGNHDVLPTGSNGETYDPTNYLANFGPQEFAGRSWYGGASPAGTSSYQTFRAGGREFLALHLNVDTPRSELVWAQEVLNSNRDKPTLITTHRYMQDAEDYLGGFPLVPSGVMVSRWKGLRLLAYMAVSCSGPRL
jgi:DNA repair exonuclease SbcCD nuclease subunit